MSDRLDPVTLEVIRNALPAIANEMAADLQRTSYNMMIYEVRDFCTAVVTADGRLVSQNVGGVSHFVADLGVIVTDGMNRYGADGFAPEDVIITNHQAVAGQHLNNVVIYTPYFRDGELLFFSMVRAHWIDVGGMSTGFGAGQRASDPWMEGLQLDQLKIYRAGAVDAVLHKVISDNIRYPESSMGDMRSQIAACRLANRRLDELFDKYGRNVMLAALERVFAETEAKCRNIVARMPDGVYEAESFFDDDGMVKDEPLRIHARVTVKGSDMTIDLSGCAGERDAGTNGRTYAGARVAYKALTAPNEPVNEGSFGALDVVIPEGSIMMARFPKPMTGWGQVLPTVVDTVLAALSPAMKDRVPAAHHGMLGGSVVFFGVHPRTNKSFVLQSIEGGGWGGRPHEDGESASVSVCQGDVRNATIEGMELKNPIVVAERSLRVDSGGPGAHRGGLAVELRVRNRVEGRWNMARPRRNRHPPWGLWGGRPGDRAGYFLKRPGENEFRFMDVVRYPVPAESEVIVRTGGGGGWGDPLDRDPERVRWDVVEGLVTVDAAAREYGVVLDAADLSVDAAATARLRARRAEERPPEPDSPGVTIAAVAPA